MTALAVILIVLAVITILLLLPATVRIKYDDKLYIYAGYIMAFRIYPPKREKKAKIKTERQDKRKKIKKSKTLNLSVSEITELAGAAIKAVVNLLKTIRIPVFILHLIISGSDAAKAAINYGTVCMCLSTLYPVIEDKTKLKKKDISVDLDYGGTSSVSLDVTLNAMLAKLLIIFITALITAIKVIRTNKRKAVKNNEQHSGKHGNGNV